MGKKSKTVGLHYEVMNMNHKVIPLKVAKDAKGFLKDVILMWEKKGPDAILIYWLYQVIPFIR